jgi:signal transduction histidine kinase
LSSSVPETPEAAAQGGADDATASQGIARDAHRAVAREVMARAAHALRNPLTGVHLTLSRLRRQASEPEIREGLRDSIEGVEEMARTLSRLVDAYALPEPVEEVALARLLPRVAEAARTEVGEGVQVDCSVAASPVCVAPCRPLQLALLGLVRNAAEAMGGAGRVELRAYPSGPWARVEVQDQGPGFPSALLGSADRLARELTATPSFGLAIARRVVTEAGGQMELDNRPGGCVVLDLPAANG